MPIIPESEIDLKISKLNEQEPGIQFYFASAFDREWSHSDFCRMQVYNVHPQAEKYRTEYFKSYPNSERIPLSRDLIDLSRVHLGKVLLERTAQREFSRNAITFSEFSTLLRYGNGIKKDLPAGAYRYEKKDLLERTAPSGGGRFPIELYMFIFNVKGLEPGFYHYNIREFALEKIKVGFLIDDVKELFMDPIDFANSGALFLMTGVFNRTIEKYGTRGWRILFQEVGHMVQNFWIVAGALGMVGTPLAGGFDKKIARYLKVNSHQEGLLESFVFGLPKNF